MKITSSNVAMASTHRESSFTYKESMSLEAAKSKNAAGVILSLSAQATGKNLKESMVDYKKQEEEQAKQKQKENQAKSLQRMAEEMRTQKSGSQYEINDDWDYQIKMLRRILAALRGEKVPDDLMDKPKRNDNVTDLRSGVYRNMEGVSFTLSTGANVSIGSQVNMANRLEVGTTGSGTTWQKITATSGFVTETEATTFASKGLVTTADGRKIDFNVEVSMSRAFMAEFNLLDVKEYVKTDPLMINLDTNVGSVREQKFYFDLNSDGKKEKISFAGEGSGFLALDRNGDGVINDGSELFGTKSGDGFKDLARYDEDNNGWIDENDSIYDKLVVWTKDAEGNDQLMDLKKADVGAIYLRSANTQFSLKNDEHQLNGEIKKTGIYLKESTGEVGTMNHVDLVV